MSGGEPAISPELSERVERVRAALPDADRAWFEQGLDQALDMARSTWDLRPLSHVVEGWWWVVCSLVSTVAGGGRRPRRGFGGVLSPSGRANRWAWRT